MVRVTVFLARHKTAISERKTAAAATTTITEGAGDNETEEGLSLGRHRKS